jgi:hypothetical protein
MNSNSLTPQQTLFLWDLISKGGTAWLSEVKPKPKSAATWRALERSGLILSVKRQREAHKATRAKKKGKAIKHAAPRKSNALWIEVTERGWGWANDHLGSPLPTKSPSAGPILQAWLTHLQAFLRQKGFALADLISARPEVGSPIALEERIRRVYLDATGGAWNKRLRLSELRTLLDGVRRAELDKVLMRMQQGGDLVLYPLDNPKEITAADRDASIAIGGTHLHIVYMRG